MATQQPSRQVEELMGRRDAVRGEITQAQQEQKKFASQNLEVAAREAAQDVQRLQQRLAVIERELDKLRKFW